MVLLFAARLAQCYRRRPHLPFALLGSVVALWLTGQSITS